MLARRAAIDSSLRRLLFSTSSTASASERPWVSNSVASSPRSPQHLACHGIEGAEVLLDGGSGGVAFAADLVHGGDEFRDARHHRPLERAHVLVRAAENFLQQNVGFAQPLEQCGGVGTQHPVGFQHVGNGRRGGLFRFLDRRAGSGVQLLDRPRQRRFGRFADALSAFLQLAERPRHGRGGILAGVVDEPCNFLAVVHHGLSKREALGLDRLNRLVGDAAHFAGEFLAPAGKRHDQRVRLLVEEAGHLADALRYGGRDFIGPAGDVTRNFGAGAA